MSNVVQREKGLNFLGTMLLCGGAFLLTLFAALIIWPNFEAEVAGRLMPNLEPIDSLRCPLLLNGDEERTISAQFVNPTDEPLRLRIDSQISEGSLTMMRTDQREIFIPANTTEEVEWMISADDAAHDRFIVAKFHALRNREYAATASNCGIMTMNLPFLSGRQIVTALVASSVLLVGVGTQRILSERPLTRRGKRMLLQLMFLLLGIAIPLFAGMFGYGLVALPLAAIPALILISLMEYALQ